MGVIATEAINDEYEAGGAAAAAATFATADVAAITSSAPSRS